jgi:asparagine synthetase B (glutamine-hydrolysing)
MCLALPPTQKLRDGMTRSVARRALSDLLPPAVRHRTDKANLGPAFRHALLETAADDIDRMLAEDGHHIRGYVDVEATRALFSDCRAGRASPEPLSFIWRATLLARWMALHHDTPVPALLDDPPHRMQPPMSVASSLPA